jgi:predicted nuclease of predicted toxin-antitoxin system
MIKILLDQNIPGLIEPWLQHEVGDKAEIKSTRSLAMQRMADDEIFHFCQQQKMVIVIYDEDFQNPLVIKNIPGYGTVRLNIYPTGYRQTQQALQRLLASYPIETWEKASIVVDPHKIRYQKRQS